MSLTTAPASHDPARDFPELAPYARTVVRLHPRRGVPGPRGSHLGGPMLWPAAEPWPRCGEHEEPMAAVAQLTTADFPEIRFPDGTDVVQLLWCPDWHDQPHPEGWGQACRLFWRRAAEVTDLLTEQPRSEDPDPDMVPRPCVLHPERLTEYPCVEELPAGPARRYKAWLAGRNLPDDVSAIPGYKLGGSMTWGVTDRPEHLECEACRAPLELFLQFDTSEYGLGSWGPEGTPDRFWPLEERGLEPRTDAWWAALEPTGMTIGRGGHAGLFVCSADPRHPASHFTQ
ncbi:hypothetical protein ACFXDH_21365 [Streptomyces sp. NPDC059467]|uniref:hypothetical protein n=1 Tax=Streptomyces sp. NPDC059467 TaxID=3346844 RepID=UPI00369F2924